MNLQMLDITFFAFSILIIFLSIIAHECAHGWMAYHCGDPTAKQAGRLTINPLKHIDPVGTLIVPGILLFMRFIGYPVIVFGWAKPVPVNFSNLNYPKRDMVWVGLAGPLTNIAIALFFRIILLFPFSGVIQDIAIMSLFVNLLLAVFNLIPVPPLDGSRLVMGLLPIQLARKYALLETYGILIVIVLLYTGLLDYFVWPIVNSLAVLMGVPLS